MAARQDENGTWEAIPQPSTAIVEVLVEPSTSFETDRAAAPALPKGIDFRELADLLAYAKEKGWVQSQPE